MLGKFAEGFDRINGVMRGFIGGKWAMPIIYNLSKGTMRSK
jgi:DNA-binding HxlR family transcriptional regulator